MNGDLWGEICSVDRVQAVGWNLGPVLDIDILDDTGSCILKRYYGVPARQWRTSKRRSLRMKRIHDFVERLDKEMSIKILLCLENPKDLASVCAVSKSWCSFVIENGLFKQLCLKLCPDVSKIIGAEFIDHPEEVAIDTPRLLKRDHRVFSLLSWSLKLAPSDYLIKYSVCASSTDRSDRYQIQRDRGIHNTLKPKYVLLPQENAFWPCRAYWSSEGTSDPTIPEYLFYELVTELCVISEIYVQPLEASWERRRPFDYVELRPPIYSAEAVRFSLGHRRSPHKLGITSYFADVVYNDDMFEWTYISPEFPMAQTTDIQKFPLPKPVVCTGGLLKVELLGRVQKSYIDDLYYICVDRLQALGQNLGPVSEIVDDTKGCILERLHKILLRQWRSFKGSRAAIPDL